MKHVSLLTIFVLTLACVTSCDHQSAPKPSGKSIKIGIIAPFSNRPRTQGTEGMMGIKTAQQMHPSLNNGDVIELVIEDDSDDPAETIRVLKKLLEVDKVAAILILSDSDSVLAISPLADAYKTPILALIATHPKITRNNTFVTQLVFDDAFQGAVTALFVRDELLLDKAAVFSNPNSASSTFLTSTFIAKFKSTGGQITDTIRLSKTGNDYVKILTDVRKHNPELLYLPVKPAHILGFIKAAKQLQWQPQMIGSDGLVAKFILLLENNLDAVDGLLAVDFFSDDMPLTAYGKDAYAVFKSLYNLPATPYVSLGFEGYALLLNAMNRCDDAADKLCINDMLRSTTNFVGVTGKISILSNGKAHRPLIINNIQDNKVNFLVKVY